MWRGHRRCKLGSLCRFTKTKRSLHRFPDHWDPYNECLSDATTRTPLPSLVTEVTGEHYLGILHSRSMFKQTAIDLIHVHLYYHLYLRHVYVNDQNSHIMAGRTPLEGFILLLVERRPGPWVSSPRFGVPRHSSLKRFSSAQPLGLCVEIPRNHGNSCPRSMSWRRLEIQSALRDRGVGLDHEREAAAIRTVP